MYDLLVFYAFCSVIAVAGVACAKFLVETFFRYMDLDSARQCIDDASDDPESVSWKVHRISLKSNRLSNVAVALIIPLVAAVLVAFASSMPIGMGLTVAMYFIAADVRARQARYEAAFHAVSGLTVDDVCASFNRHPDIQRSSSETDQSGYGRVLMHALSKN